MNPNRASIILITPAVFGARNLGVGGQQTAGSQGYTPPPPPTMDHGCDDKNRNW